MHYREAMKHIKDLARTVGSGRFGLMHAEMHTRGKVVIQKRCFIEGVGVVEAGSWREACHHMGAKTLCKLVSDDMEAFRSAFVGEVPNV